jgi:arylsulfatase
METIDDETSAAAIDFMKREHDADKPFFAGGTARACTCAPTSGLSIAGRYKHGDSEYIDGMIEHDETVGRLLKALDDMGIANDTIVVTAPTTARI